MEGHSLPSELILPLDLRPRGPKSAQKVVGDLPLVEHEQHWGHWEQEGQKHNDRQKKHILQNLFLLCLLMEDLSLSFVAALSFLLQNVHDWFCTLQMCMIGNRPIYICLSKDSLFGFCYNWTHV